jgi:hypothetical protein
MGRGLSGRIGWIEQYLPGWAASQNGHKLRAIRDSGTISIAKLAQQ